MVEILKMAERMPNGRVKGVAPAQLWPKIVRHLSVQELAQIESVRAMQVEVNRKMKRLLSSLGLDSRRPYRFDQNGDVIEVGAHKAVY